MKISFCKRLRKPLAWPSTLFKNATDIPLTGVGMQMRSFDLPSAVRSTSLPPAVWRAGKASIITSWTWAALPLHGNSSFFSPRPFSVRVILSLVEGSAFCSMKAGQTNALVHVFLRWKYGENSAGCILPLPLLFPLPGRLHDAPDDGL